MSNADQVADSHSPISIAEFARRQLAVVERQMLSGTDLANLIELSITGIRQLSGGSQVELRTESSFHRCDLSTLEDNDVAQIAHSLISAVEQSLVRDPS
jgi:hypothetical protein